MILSLIISLFATFACWILLANAKTFESEKCGPFFCPDNCNTTWYNECPHSCICNSPKFCPSVSCPSPVPPCLILTKVDGCETCLCHQPVISVKSTSRNPNDTDVVFFDKRRFCKNGCESGADISGSFNDSVMADSSTKATSFPSKCGARSRLKVEKCLQKFLMHRSEFKQSGDAEKAVATFNPLIEQHRRTLFKTCDVYEEALLCMGPSLFNTCHRFHFDLSVSDAFYGYICGAKRLRYSIHYSCLQEAHKVVPRLKLCEDLLASSLLHLIQNDTLSNQQYAKRKCMALNWFAECEKPDIRRYCSSDAAVVYSEAVSALADYVLPGCISADALKRNYFNVSSGMITWTTVIPTRFSSSFCFTTIQLSDLWKKLKEKYTCLSTITVNHFFPVELETETTKVAGGNWTQGTEEQSLSNTFNQQIVVSSSDLMNFSRSEELLDENITAIVLNSTTDNYSATFNYTDQKWISEREKFINQSSTQIKTVSLSDLDLDTSNFDDDLINDVSEPLWLSNSTLRSKEEPECSVDFRRQINQRFSSLFYEIRAISEQVNFLPSHPIIFLYSKRHFHERCGQYRSALNDIDPKANVVCQSRYDVYDQVYNAFSSACSKNVECNLNNHFDCIVDSVKNEDIQQCIDVSQTSFRDPTLNQCDAYLLFVECIREPTLTLCQMDGWKTLYQLLSFTTQITIDPTCQLPYTPDGVKITN